MKKTLALAAILFLAPALTAPPAQAGIFSVNVAFNVGGLFFDLGFGGPRYAAHDRHYVYRVSEPFHYEGYSCHSGCYRDGGYIYHHADCPAVAVHFRTYAFSPYVSYPSFFAAPVYRSYRSHGAYPPHRHYDRFVYRSYRDHRTPRTYGRSYRDHRDRYDRHRGSARHFERDRVRGDVRGRHQGSYRDRSGRVDRSHRGRQGIGQDRYRGEIRRRDAGSTRSRDRGGNHAERERSRGRGRR